MGEEGSPHSYQECGQEEYFDQGSCFIGEDTKALNKKGRDDLNDLYINNQKFRDEVVNLIGDKTGLNNEKNLDKRYEYITLNKQGMEV